MGRRVEVPRNLPGQPRIGGQRVRPRCNERGVPGHPLQVPRSTRRHRRTRQGRHDAMSPSSKWIRESPSACACSIISGEESTPTTSASGHRAASSCVSVPGPAAQIDDPARRDGADPVDQVDERPPSFVSESAVLGGIPAHKQNLSTSRDYISASRKNWHHGVHDRAASSTGRSTRAPWAASVTRSMRSSRPGSASGLISMSSRCRSSRGSLASRPGSTTGARKRSSITACSGTNSTCWPHFAGPVIRSS